MSELVYENMEAVMKLNKVEGFEPKKLMRRIISDNNEEQLYLDVKYRKLWFRLMYPMGKIVKSIVQLTEQVAVVEAKIYLDRNDSPENYVANAMAQKWFSNDIFGSKYVELAETAAVGRALSDAGFGVQFADIGEESDASIVDAGITVTDEIRNENAPLDNDAALNCNPVQNQPLSTTNNGVNQPSTPPSGAITPTQNVQNIKPIQEKSVSKPELNKDMPVEQLYGLLTKEDAAKVVVSFGFNKGKTLGQIAVEKPDNLKWYIESYNGPDNILRAGAKRLMDAAFEQKAS